MSGLSDALRIALGGLSGGLQGYGQKQEDLEKRRQQALLEQRQAEADKQARDTAAISALMSGVRPLTPGETLGAEERMITLPSGEQRVLGQTPAERAAEARAKAAEKALGTKQTYENRGVYDTLTHTIDPDTKKPFLDPSIPFEKVEGRLQSAFELAKQKLGQAGSMERVLAAQATQDARWNARQEQAARSAYNRNLSAQETNYRTTTKEFRTKAEGVSSLIDALSKKNAVFDQAAMDSFIRAITGKAPVNAQYQTTQALGSLPDRARQAFERAMKGDILPPKVRQDMLDFARTVVQSGEEELAPYQQNVGTQLRSQADFMGVQPNIAADSAVVAPNFFNPAKAKLQRIGAKNPAALGAALPAANLLVPNAGTPQPTQRPSLLNFDRRKP